MSRTIFIVENEFIIAEDLRAIVEHLGYQTVGYARSLSEAKERIRANVPALVLLDVQLSGKMDGLELARWLREQHQVPFVYVTSFADATTRQAMDETSPIGYLAKPFNQQDVQAALTVAFAVIDHSKT